MKRLVSEAGLEKEFFIDSAGMHDYHEGELADPRMRAHASRRGYNLTHRSRPVRSEDFDCFDLLIGMDDQNIRALHRLASGTDAAWRIVRMTDYCTMHPDNSVPDPYYSGPQGFEHVIDLLEDACRGLLDVLLSTRDNQSSCGKSSSTSL